MNIIESLNKVINEAAELPFWVKTDRYDQENVEFTKKLWNCFVDHCQQLNLTLIGSQNNCATFASKEVVNYDHFITFNTETSEIFYIVKKDNKKVNGLTFNNVVSCEDIDKAFEQIVPMFEGME